MSWTRATRASLDLSCSSAILARVVRSSWSVWTRLTWEEMLVRVEEFRMLALLVFQSEGVKVEEVAKSRPLKRLVWKAIFLDQMRFF